MRAHRLLICRPAIAFAALAILAGCASQGPGSDELVIQQLTVREELRAGSVDDRETSLTHFTGVAVSSDGRMYTLHPSESRIRVHAADGTQLPPIGRRGRGPGELSGLYTMGLIGDTLWVIDIDNNRLSYFSTDGAFLFTRRISVSDGAVSGRDAARARSQFTDGTIEAAPMSWLFLIAAGMMTEQPILRIDTTGQVLDTLARLPFRNTAFTITHDPASAGSGTDFMQPFTDDELLLVARSGREVVHVDRTIRPGSEPTFRLTRRTTEGDTVFTQHYPYVPLPIPESMVDSIVHASGTAAVRAGQPSRLTPAAAEAQVRRKLYRPAHLPAVSKALLGRDGSIWLRRELTADPTVAWLILDPGGEPLGTATLPRGFDLMEADASTVWGMERDELDVPYLVRYGIGPAVGDETAPKRPVKSATAAIER